VDEAEKRVWVERDGTLTETLTRFFERIVAEDVSAFAVSRDYASGLHHMMDQLESRGAEQGKLPVLKGLGMKGRWMIRALKRNALEVIIFFDEPILSALGTPAYMRVQDEEVVAGRCSATA